MRLHTFFNLIVGVEHDFLSLGSCLAMQPRPRLRSQSHADFRGSSDAQTNQRVLEAPLQFGDALLFPENLGHCVLKNGEAEEIFRVPVKGREVRQSTLGHAACNECGLPRALEEVCGFQGLTEGDEAGEERTDIFGYASEGCLRFTEVVKIPTIILSILCPIVFFATIGKCSSKIDGFIDGIHRTVGDAFDEVFYIIKHGQIVRVLKGIVFGRQD